MSDRHESPNAGGESASSGFSLVAVLVFMLIVSAIVVPFAVTAKTRLMIANNEVEQERLSLLAEGLGNVVASELTGEQAMQKCASIAVYVYEVDAKSGCWIVRLGTRA